MDILACVKFSDDVGATTHKPTIEAKWRMSNKMDESELMELPAAQASKASFPPGCFVWIHSNEANSSSEYEVREGVVHAVFLDDVFSASKKFFYKLEIEDENTTEMVEESKLTFASNTPVLFAATRQRVKF